jgi:hypothetical protein
MSDKIAKAEELTNFNLPKFLYLMPPSGMKEAPKFLIIKLNFTIPKKLVFFK